MSEHVREDRQQMVRRVRAALWAIEHEDELFYVVNGSFRMELRDRTVELHEGEMFVVPRGVEHRPVADDQVRAQQRAADRSHQRAHVRLQ